MATAHTEHTWEVYTSGEGEPRVRCDAAGTVAVSAPIGDPFALIAAVARECGLTVADPGAADHLIIYRPGAEAPAAG
jgi:hypothetical protein